MDIDVLRPRDLTAGQVDHWRALQSADPSVDSPFLSPLWAQSVERVQGGEDPGLRVAVLRSRQGDCGFMAVRAGPFTAMAPGAPMCDYQGLVAEPGVTLDPRRLVRALGVGRFDFSHMLVLPGDRARRLRGLCDGTSRCGRRRPERHRQEAPQGRARDRPLGLHGGFPLAGRLRHPDPLETRAAARHRPDRHLRRRLDPEPAPRPVRPARPGIRRRSLHPAPGGATGGGAPASARPQRDPCLDDRPRLRARALFAGSAPVPGHPVARLWKRGPGPGRGRLPHA